MKKAGFILVVMLCLLVTSVSARVYFSQPESIYNLGDLISLNVDIDQITEGFLKIDLVCDESSLNVYYGIPNENVHIELPLTFLYIQNINGDCYFAAGYSDVSYNSRDFKISKALNVWLNIDSLVTNPGESITVSGTAKRLNDVGINGDVKITIPLLNIMVSEPEETEENETEETDTNETEEDNETEETQGIGAGEYYGKVVDGVFSVSITLKEDTPAGNYGIEVLAYEKDSSDQTTSEGIVMASLKVQQILKQIDVAVNNQNIDPGAVLDFKPILLDQTGMAIYDEVSIVIRDEHGDRIYEKIVQSETTIQYEVPTDLPAGYYEIEVSNNDVNTIKSFYINEKAIASFEIKNNSLIVTNIGNIRYKKDIEVELNGKPFVKKVDLGLGKSQEFKLSGDGEYNIKITDGEAELVNQVALTGHAVNVKAISDSVLFSTPIAWIFLVIILGAGLLFLFRNILKKKSFAYPVSKFKGKLKDKLFHRKSNEDVNLKSDGQEIAKNKDKENVARPLVFPHEAEKVLVLTGKKNTATILILKIKNKIARNTKKNLNKILQSIAEKKGAIYEYGDYIYVIFSPLLTRSFKNEVKATKVAGLLQHSLQIYNKKFKEKIEFGLGIGSGEIVNKVEDKKLKFTPLGNFLNLTKKLAGISEEKILLTKESYERGAIEIKSVKKNIGDLEFHEVRRVIDSEANKKFLDSFLRRIGEGKK